MYRVLLIMFLYCFSHLGLAQVDVVGKVYDIGNRQILKNVLVKATNSDLTSKTNNSGIYKFNLNIEDLTTENTNDHYYILNNNLFWNLATNITVKIYSINGKLIFSKSSSNSGFLSLPAPQIGYYLLHIFSDKNNIKLILFSNGRDINSVSKKSLNLPILARDSILLLSKSGYFDRKVSIDLNVDTQKINILKKSYEDLDYFNGLMRKEAFSMIQSSPPITNYGEIQSVKAIFDFVKDEIYYINTNKYASHFKFAKKFLNFKGDKNIFLHSQYSQNPNRYLNLITINYHKNIDKYVFEFGSYDLVDCDGIISTYNKLIETSYLKGKLFFYANSSKWENCEEVPTISSEELYNGQNYQALNLEEAYGYLKKVHTDSINSYYLGKHDIVLTNGIPNDLSVVSGIITTEFQTALSHINILSHNRKTPNMALRDGWTNPKLTSLIGELVYLKVESDSFIIRKASIDQAKAFWSKNEPQTPIKLAKDTITSGLIDLQNADISWVKTIGGKAANFAELVNLGSIPVPEEYFAIPFYYYEKHLKTNGIDSIIDTILNESKFYENIDYRSQKLKEIRDKIKDAPLDTLLEKIVSEKIHYFKNFASFRFRSSTNAEDLENFSGAGLYDSKSAKKDKPKKTVSKTIKKVWASLWNLRAFDEREYYKIDHRTTAMGILVHRSFPDEDANGVIITKNLYNINHAYTINVQYKEYSIVYPKPGILHDQILVYTFSLDGNDYSIEYLTHSNIPELNGNTVLTKEELFEIADYCTSIKKHYFYNLPNNCNCTYNDFAVDIEFKVDSQVKDRKIYIKQVRIYAN